MTEREKMLAGQLYDVADPELVSLRRHARLLFEQYNRSSVREGEKRRLLLEQLLGSLGSSCTIEPDFRCDYGCNIHVGENFYANFGCVILDVAEVRIGSNCLLGPGVSLFTATHPVEPELRLKGLELGLPITIGDNCWLGGRSVINPGVTLGNNVVVASGAVVTKSFPDNVVLAGVPARVVKEIKA